MALNDDDDNDFTLPENDAADQLGDVVEETDENVFAVELMQAMRSPQLLLEETTPRGPACRRRFTPVDRRRGLRGATL